MRQVFLDTETTGLSPENGDKVIEIGCVEFVSRKPTGRVFHHYINPERESSPEALAVHGISNESLQDKPKFAEVAQELAAFIEGAELVIHNAPFDLGFLNAEFKACGMRGVGSSAASVVDSLQMAKRQWPGKRNGLDTLCDRLGVDRSGRTFHGALLDAQLLADVYIGMTRGQDALAIDVSPNSGTEHRASHDLPLHALELPVILADASELQLHDALLTEMSKSKSGTPAVWLA